MRPVIFLAFTALFAACAGDKDGDTATDTGAATDTGPDTVLTTGVDSDGDGLTDGEEAALGTNPALLDSDGDGYGDGDEVTEGSDPLDDQSRIYAGGWPYVSDKDAIVGPAPDPVTVAVGTRFARVALVDQFGDTVDLYDFYNADKPVVIDISAQWCEPCWNVATWLEGGEDPDGHAATWPAGPAVFARGDVYWLTVLSENEDHLPADAAAPAEWVAAFPTSMPVLADEGYLTTDHVGVFGYPTLVLLEPDLTVAVIERYDAIQSVLTALAVRFPQ